MTTKLRYHVTSSNRVTLFHWLLHKIRTSFVLCSSDIKPHCYTTNLVSDIMDGEHWTGDWLVSDNGVKICSSVMAACTAAACPINWLKVFRVSSMFQLKLSSWNQSYSKPLISRHQHILTLLPFIPFVYAEFGVFHIAHIVACCQLWVIICRYWMSCAVEALHLSRVV